MKIKFLSVAILTGGLIAACSGNGNASAESETQGEDTLVVVSEVTEEAMEEDVVEEPMVNNDEVIIDFISEFYTKCIFGNSSFNRYKKHISKGLLKKLAAAYDYDDGGYATWLFRSDNQDGPSNVSKIKEVVPEGDGWYLVKFTDMGNAGSHRLKADVVDDMVMIEELK